MDETQSDSGFTWADIEIPSHVLMIENNVKGVTNNPPIQAEVVSSTINRDFLCFRFAHDPIKSKWRPADLYQLLEVIVPPINPTTTKEA
jgi:hypothetical protein